MSITNLLDLQTKVRGPNPRIARWAAAQGMVLLENRNKVLPIVSPKIALFGGGACSTVKGGTGSGNATTPYEVSVYQGLLNAGFTVTSAAWLEDYEAKFMKLQEEDTGISPLDKFFSGIKTEMPDPALTERDITEASDADTAIYVISRVAGEGKDRVAEEGDYYLTEVEKENLRLIAAGFKKSIVVLNTSVIDTKFFHEIEELDALLLMSLAGMEGGNALADVLSGEVTPSGKLTDTWAVNYSDYPASPTFGTNAGDGKQVNYEEGIYVGYRYFDTFHIKPAYEFGFGMSYTDFEIEVKAVTVDSENVSVQATVKNTGSKYSGKEVVQIYASAPKGKLDKPYQVLAGFGKTDELEPGKSQTLSITFPVSEMASYSEALAAWVLEAGDYLLRVGNSSRNTKVAAVIRLDESKITEQLSNMLPLDQNFTDKSGGEIISCSDAAEVAQIAAAPMLDLKAASIMTKDNASKIDGNSVTTYLTEGSEYLSKYKPGTERANRNYIEKFEYVPPCENAKLYDVYRGKITMEQFVAQMDLKTLATLVNGSFGQSNHRVEAADPIENAKEAKAFSSGSTVSNFIKSHGIPNTLLCDGPAGIHVMLLSTIKAFLSQNPETADTEVEFDSMSEAGYTAFPVGVLLAQTWDTELMTEVGKAFGKELLDNHTTVLLAPGLNIHRDPLCGRNFEYYSEDPKLTGIMGSMFVLGEQSHPGIGVSIKHFAANNQETERSGGNSSVSERALREIYLKGFEITVKSAQPMTVMTSYNKINGIQTSGSYDLCTHILRGEWGFQGYVMTDWFTVSDNGQDMHAGNDVIMGGNDISKIINAVNALMPEFMSDGSISCRTTPSYVGVGGTVIENWNSFLPQANGRDTCTAIVASEIETGEKVQEMVDRKIAAVKVNEDGSKTVTYKGTYTPAYITLGDVQKSAMNLLNVLLKSWTVNLVYNASTGYEPIEVKPYSSLFEDLKSYLMVEKR